MTNRRLLAALGFSLLLHATVVSSPGWRLPFLGEQEPGGPLQAHLAPKPAPPPAPVARPQPARAEARPAAKTPSALPPVAAQPAEPAVPPANPEPPAAPIQASPVVATAAAQAALAWPRRGRIRFAIARGEGEQTLQIGQSIHTWQHDGTRYSLRAVTETTGLVALFRNVRIVQLSEGTLTAEGLVPQSFGVERNGRPAERARFDWADGTVTLQPGGGSGREARLAAGAQDLLSQIYQIGLLGAPARTELMIATGKSYGRYAYEAVGEENIATGLGELRTVHLKTPALPGEQAMELWLASDYRNLPVRIRFVDRKGEVFDQNVVELEADETTPAERP